MYGRPVRPGSNGSCATSGRTDESGAVAIIAAICMAMLCVVGAMVVDLGLLRVDRQSDKSAEDAAAMAGVNGLVPDIADPSFHPFAGVCQAMHYLQANSPAFSSFSGSAWYDGTGYALGGGVDGCDSSHATLTCTPNTPSTWARFVATSSDGTKTVTIQSGYPLSGGNISAVTGGDFPEENPTNYPAYSGDTGDAKYGDCDQLAVIVTVHRATTLGVPAASGMGTRTRSVARVNIQQGDQAPALLLLEQHHCSVLTVGSAGGGSGSHIHVLPSGSTPGTIHSDSDAIDTGLDSATDPYSAVPPCSSGSNDQLFQGHQSDAIVAYGTGSESGTITSVASKNGADPAVVSDSSSNVYGTTATGPGLSGATEPVTGRNIVTRAPVDNRYADGVRSAISSAAPYLAYTAAPSGWKSPTCDAASIAAANIQPTDSVFLDCGASTIGTGTTPIVVHGQTIVFHGRFKSGGLDFPDVRNLYLTGDTTKPAITVSTGNSFCLRTTQCDSNSTTVAACPSGATGDYSDRAAVFIQNDGITQSGGLLRLCNTTVILLGGQSDGCVPADNSGPPPTSTPCDLSDNSGHGNGLLKINGGIQDWTAPNKWDVIPAGEGPNAWTNNLEDLALWDETWGGTTNDNAYTMAGGGNTHTQGVFMVPNASPFGITGSGVQNLVNAQYIADSVTVNGGAQLNMTVDPNAAVTPPAVTFYLVR